MQAIGKTDRSRAGRGTHQAAEYRARLDRVRSARSDWSDLSYASIYSFGGTTLGVESPINGNSIVQVLESLNLRPLPEADDVAREGRRFFELSFEELRRVDADVVLWFKDGTDLTTLANWSSLGPSEAGQAHSYPAFGASSYPTFNRALDFLEPILIEADSDIIDESSWS
ncbi:MAG: hypothetical protein U5Q44_01785 [Dehalococcoidia bacterium]|nr:hypothetical protein [Dehalococcoidia bacterium]